MKVLLTGASGFVGSHILESLREHKLNTAILLRNNSATRFLHDLVPGVEVRFGSINDLESLRKATTDITHVIHCAGCTKAVKRSDYFEANQQGTRNLVEVLNSRAAQTQRLLHVSSLAASGPSTSQNPRDEESNPRPVSDYGKSKLAGELEVREHCRSVYTIIRPPAVYGPRDSGFFAMFKAIKNHILPRPSGAQELSLVYVKDLARAIVACMINPLTAGKTYFVASPEIVTSRTMADEIARQMKRWTVPCPIPNPVLWMVCLFHQLRSQITRQASLLNLQKYAELRAPGWVCSPAKLQRETGLVCETRLGEGIAQTLAWYTREHWL